MKYTNTAIRRLQGCVALLFSGMAFGYGTVSEMPWREVPDHDTIAQYESDVQGGWAYTHWRVLATTVADTLIKSVTDHYGDRTTPLWVAGIDPDTGMLIEQKPPNWQTYWDAEDYIMTVQGCNLQRDLPMLTALTRLGGDLHTASARQYLDFWLRECPGPKTGLFPWGEHMSYNCVRDKLIAERHEMEYNPPDWELLWRVNPDAVRREIEAIHTIHIWDKERGLFDRHGNYYTGEFDPMPVRGGYIKHSGLYAHAFMFLYTKTGLQEHLDWARQMADLYWRNRAPETNLIYGYVSAEGAHDASSASMLLAYYLLEAVKLHDDPFVRERALGIVDSFLKYGYNASTQQFANTLDPATGAASDWGGAPWHHANASGFKAAYAIWDAYEITKDKRYLDVFEARLRNVAETAPLMDGEGKALAITPGAAGEWIQLYVKAFTATGEKRYLQHARGLAAWSAKHLVRNNYILEAANGYVYLNYGRPGDLISGWLDLYEAEDALPIHWYADPVKPGETLNVYTWAKSANITVNGQYSQDTSGDSIKIDIPLNAKQGLMPLVFSDTSKSVGLDSGNVLVAKNPRGPEISEIKCPKYIDAGTSLEGDVKISDPAGVIEATCQYVLPDGKGGSVACTATDADPLRYRFTIPTVTGIGAVTFTIVAKGNPEWPITSTSEKHRVPVAQVKQLVFAPGATKASTEGIEVELNAQSPLPGGTIRVHYVPVFEVKPKGTTEKLLPGCIAWEPDAALKAASLAQVKLDYDAKTAGDLLPESITVFQVNGGVVEIPLDTKKIGPNRLEFGCSMQESVQLVLGGTPRLACRRTFNGALLTSPAVARIDQNGALAIILTTGAPDGVVYALNVQGETLWKYDAKGAQPFPTVADVDGDGLDEIAIGGTALRLLGPDGSLRWQVEAPQSNTPAIGDVTGDASPEILVAAKTGGISAFSAKGKPLWRTETGEGLAIPALAHFEEGKTSIIVGGKNFLLALNGDGTERWRVPQVGDARLAPAVGDLNNDGHDEVVSFSRSDTQGAMTAVDGLGHVLWTAEVSRESDWSPVIALMDGPGKPRILAQMKDPKKIGIFDAQGQLVRTLDTTGRLLQSPVPVDLDGDGRLDLLTAHDLSYRLWAIGNDGTPLWSYTPQSLTLPGAKIKMGGSLLVADLNGDEKLEVVGGDDETWLNVVRTATPCPRGAIVSGQYHGDSGHRGCYGR